MYENYCQFFEKNLKFKPFPYQEKMALTNELPSLVSIPTGMGKTASVILAWIWRRRFADSSVQMSTPRRLVYCLPMRVLVEQTADAASKWLHSIGLLAENAPEEHPEGQVAVHVLMGGDLERDWDRWPDRDQILIGTQDMLLSRALNRGYSMSRYRWPMQFALLNNDALWVMDEVQLMGDGLATTAQLQAFRRQLGTWGTAASLWMSATMKPEWLDTVDADSQRDFPGLLKLSDDDKRVPEVRQRLDACKNISIAREESEEHVSSARIQAGDHKKAAGLILSKHAPQTLTLVVVNTVKRARAIHKALQQQLKAELKQKKAPELLLIHSHFRPGDRKALIDRLLATPSEYGTIAVSTQVVEAGVDVSARKLFTDLAPWTSLVQRFGRCNRKGEQDGAAIFWFDIDTSKSKDCLPYEPEQLDTSKALLEELENAAPSALPDESGKMDPAFVVRKKDLLDLFDTTPDLAGADIDVSRFIRESDDHNVQLFWRNIDKSGPSPDEPPPARDELCSAPIQEVKDLLKKGSRLWRWDHLERVWRPVQHQDVYPGLTLLADSAAGGYSEETGWDVDAARKAGKKKPVPVLNRNEDESGGLDVPEWNDGDPDSVKPSPVTLAEHSDFVVSELDSLLSSLDNLFGGQEQGGTERVDSDLVSVLLDAARWHDCGKAHPVFQTAMGAGGDSSQILAKALDVSRYERAGFRHELASAIAMLLNGRSDLAAYLAAAHHGKVRLSIRSLPIEQFPDNPDTRFARGVLDGDVLPSAKLGGGEVMPETRLNLSYMELGEDPETGESWLARMLKLRDQFGPFRLAFLETLLRIADWRGSARGGDEQ
jgi:CRISPR-associated endonuclease/helicase Cas3